MAKVLWIGTFDPNFARNRKLARLLELRGHVVDRRVRPIWGDQRYELPTGASPRLALRALLAYAWLLWQMVRAPRPDVVLIGYPGWFDAILVGRVARWRRLPVVFDPFISLNDTVVADRRIASEGSTLDRLTRLVDRWSLRTATRVLADTPAHADFYASVAGIPRRRFDVLWLGADDATFGPRPEIEPSPRRVVFHGTFIGLQGLETIVRAAKALEDDGIEVRIIGSGQEQGTVDRLLERLAPTNVTLTGMIPLSRVPEEIAAATLCLGIFGESDKAGRVIPNKLYECLAVGRPVLTGATPAVEDALPKAAVATAPVGDPVALASTIRHLVDEPDTLEAMASAGHELYRERFHEEVLADLLDDTLRSCPRP